MVASFPVTEDEQLMLATNGGTVIRIRVHGQEGDSIRIASRKTQGVTLFSLGKDEKVVSVGLIREDDDEEDEDIAADVTSEEASDDNTPEESPSEEA